jgi:hypothetical protein
MGISRLYYARVKSTFQVLQYYATFCRMQEHSVQRSRPGSAASSKSRGSGKSRPPSAKKIAYTQEERDEMERQAEIRKKHELNTRVARKETKNIVRRLRKRVREWHGQDATERYGVDIGEEVSAHVQRAATFAAVDQEVRDDMIKNKAFKCLCEWMLEEPSFSNIQGWCTYMMGQLCAEFTDTYGAQCCQVGGTNAILKQMTRHRLVPANQWMALKALHEILGNSVNAQDEICKRDGVPLIVSALRNHPGDNRVQYHGYLLLGNMCHSHRSNMAKALEVGAGRVIPMGMNRHQDKLAVLRTGAYLLSILAFENIPLQRQIIDAMGLVPLVQGMCAHIRDAELQKWATLALSNLVGTDGQNQLDLIKVECERALLFAMQYHKNDVAIQEYCITSIIRIAMDNLTTQTACMEADVVRQIVKTMKRHHDNIEIQILGTKAIDNCGATSTIPASDLALKIQKEVVDSKGPNIIMLGMKRFPESAELTICGLKALATLGLRNEETQHVIVQDGAFQLAIEKMVYFRSNVELQIIGAYMIAVHAAYALNNKTFQNSITGKPAFIKEDIIKTLLDTIEVHKEEQDVITMALVALGSIGYTNHNNGPVELTHRGSSAIVQAVLDAYPDNDLLQKWGYSVLGHSHAINYFNSMGTRNRWLGREKPPGKSVIPTPKVLARVARRMKSGYYIYADEKAEKEAALASEESEFEGDWSDPSKTSTTKK